MKLLRAWRLALALVLLAGSARAADQAADAPRLSPQPTAGVSASGSGLQIVAGPALVPEIPATLAPADAPRPEAGVEAAAVLSAPRAAFGRRAAPPSLPPSTAVEDAGRSAAGAAASPVPYASGSRDPLVRRAQALADKLAPAASVEVDPEPARSALRSMRTDGFSIVSVGALVTADEVRAINAEIDSYEDRRPESITTWSLYGNDKPGQWDDHPLRAWQPKNGGASAPVIKRIEQRLRDALVGEDVELRDASMRIGYRDLDNPHVDGGGYVTVTVTLQGPGTLLYRIEKDGRVQELEATVGAAAFVTNVERQQATGIPGTVHSSPTADYYARYPARLQRRLLILRFKRRGQPKLTDAQNLALRALNDRAAQRAVNYRARRGK